MSNGRIFYHLFSEQAIYTRNLIESLLEDLNNALHQENRLRQNQKDICKMSEEYIGYYKAKHFGSWWWNIIILLEVIGLLLTSSKTIFILILYEYKILIITIYYSTKKTKTL